MDPNVFDTDSEDELPSGWEERVTDEGKVYYANHSSKATQWDHPVSGKRKKVSGELPYGWERKTDDTGQLYFVDHVNQKTTYTDPRLAFAEEEHRRGNEIKQRFDAGTTALQVLQGRDLTGYYAIVTGANSGIGFETARSLALHGAFVILACRNMRKANNAINMIRHERPMASIEAMHLDLTSFKSIEHFAETFMSKDWGLHMLILNAGVFSLPYTLTEDGYEATFQTNYLGHFYLTQLLTPALVKHKHSRIVVVSAESHRFTDLKAANMTESQLSPSYDNYRPILAYNQSKMCLMLFGLEVHRRLAPRGVVCNTVHPGNVVYTGITRNWWMWKVIFTMIRPFSKSKQQAAATSVYCASAKELHRSGGYYFNNCFKIEPADIAKNPELAKTLWELSEILILKANNARQKRLEENVI